VGGSAPAGGSGAVGIPPVVADDEDDDGGCSISTDADGSSSAGLFSLLALALGVVVRRRR
jgi:MYXO-CTERM domain-containing protein